MFFSIRFRYTQVRSFNHAGRENCYQKSVFHGKIVPLNDNRLPVRKSQTAHVDPLAARGLLQAAGYFRVEDNRTLLQSSPAGNHPLVAAGLCKAGQGAAVFDGTRI